jgi:hypothetical protein
MSASLTRLTAKTREALQPLSPRMTTRAEIANRCVIEHYSARMTAGMALPPGYAGIGNQFMLLRRTINLMRRDLYAVQWLRRLGLRHGCLQTHGHNSQACKSQGVHAPHSCVRAEPPGLDWPGGWL